MLGDLQAWPFAETVPGYERCRVVGLDVITRHEQPTRPRDSWQEHLPQNAAECSQQPQTATLRGAETEAGELMTYLVMLVTATMQSYHTRFPY